MTALIWELAKKTTLKIEGAFQNKKSDRGNWTSGIVGVGECKGTKYGICAMTYPDIDIFNLTEEQAIALYKKDYWNTTKCDNIPDALSVAVFDYAVHSSPKKAIKDLQKALGVAVDGIIGNQTIGACNSKPIKEVLERYFDNRLDHMIHCKGWEENCKGWVKRWYSVKKICDGLA